MKLNDLIEKLNDVIKAVTEAHGAEYVDLDPVFEGHRFCEEGVLEPDPERSATWFFNLNLGKASVLAVEQSTGSLSQQGFLDPFKDFDLKTFHPTSLGHSAIAEEIVRHILAPVEELK